MDEEEERLRRKQLKDAAKQHAQDAVRDLKPSPF
jgi:hypothetical protein